MKISLITILASLISTSAIASLQCKKALEKCEDAPRDSKSVHRCIVDLEGDCDDKIGLDLRNKVLDLKAKLEASLKETESEKNIYGKCQDGMKWGYLRQLKNNNVYAQIMNTSMIIRLERLYGKFDSKDKCEEARLLEEGFNTSDKCFIRFVGAKKNRELYKATAMANTAKLVIYFSDLKKCESGVSRGIKYTDEDGRKYNLGPKGSAAKDRFIKECEKEDVVICEPGKSGEVFLNKIL